MSLMKWGAGLLLLNVIFTLIIYSAGSSGYIIGSSDIDVGEQSSSYGFLQTMVVGFNEMPFSIQIFLGTYQLMLVSLFILLLLRGVS